jgi:hypothetical protein
VVAHVGDDDPILAVHGHVPGVEELPVGRTGAPEPAEEVAVVIEDLDPVVAGVGDDDAVGRIDCDAARRIELPVGAAGGTERGVELAVAPRRSRCGCCRCRRR